MSTPHISAKIGEIAESVLMPGDPLRAKFVAENFLENAVCYNEIRGMYGFTGTYKGKRVSVQGSGMGTPSIGIYSFELFNFYDVQSIIRIGTGGAVNRDLRIGDVVIGQGACYDSACARQYHLPGIFAPIADYGLLEKAVSAARASGVKFKTGNILTTDSFYGETKEEMEAWSNMGILAVEMEAAALYMNAVHAKKKALCILTVSDEIFTGASAPPEERQNSFTKMMEIALETVIV